MHLQTLESRRLLSAPTAIGELVFDCTITDGTGVFADSGSFSFSTEALDDIFDIDYDGFVPDFDGTFEYEQVSDNQGRVTVTATELGGAGTLDFTFTDDLEGTWLLTAPNDDTQSGTFEITDGGNVIALDAGDPTVFPTDGNDTIVVSVSGSTITVVRNNWTDTFALGSATHVDISSGDGDDIITMLSSTPVEVSAGLGNDWILGGSGNDTLSGNGGKDTIRGGSGDDRLNGHTSADRLYGQSGNDRLYGADGNDRLDGGGNVDRAYGGLGNDTLVGGGSNDKLYGEGGNDRFYGNAGSDLLNGGTGTDTSDDDDNDSRTSIETVI
ncbi:MAG TPA: calcium-binding protein [Tepidisphaeraceae bacterium]|nr:calcium-binding protein [Tepidisphaeraceae bacterium]